MSSSNPNALTPVVKVLLIVNVALFAIQAWGPGFGIDLPLLQYGALWPIGADFFRPWQLVSYGFLHGNLFHLFFNMFGLWMFGTLLEKVWGSRRFTLFYFTCVIGAGMVQLVVATLAAREGTVYPTIGASGGVFGILLGFAMMFPNMRIMLLIPPIPIRAKYFVIIYGAIELYLGVTNTLSGIAHFAHLGGMVFALILILYWRMKDPVRMRPFHEISS